MDEALSGLILNSRAVDPAPDHLVHMRVREAKNGSNRDASRSVGKLHVLAVIPGREAGEGFVFARRQVQQLRDMGVTVTTFFLETRTSPIGLVRAATQFRRLVRTLKPAVVHAHYGTATGLFCVLLARVPVVVTFRGTDLNPSSEFSRLRAISSRWMSQLAALLAQEIICVSPELRHRLWWRRERTHVVRTGVDAATFHPIERSEARRQLGWSSDQRTILFNYGSARAPNKRYDLVAEAVAVVSRELPSVRLVVMQGDVPAARVPLYINASDVIVMASDFEGSPNIVKEALACNVPVCSVDVGDVRELLKDVSACALVERTPAALAGGLIRLLRDPLRSNGSEFSARFSTEIYTRQVFEVLHCAAVASARRG